MTSIKNRGRAIRSYTFVMISIQPTDSSVFVPHPLESGLLEISFPQYTTTIPHARASPNPNIQ